MPPHMNEEFRKNTADRRENLPKAQWLVQQAFEGARKGPASEEYRNALSCLGVAERFLEAAHLDPRTDRAWKKAGVPSGLWGVFLLQKGITSLRPAYLAKGPAI